MQNEYGEYQHVDQSGRFPGYSVLVFDLVESIQRMPQKGEDEHQVAYDFDLVDNLQPILNPGPVLIFPVRKFMGISNHQ
ncbi:hypothetical protein D3C75_1323250 [compost metagenome]